MKKILLSITLLLSILLPTNAFAQDIKIIVNNQEVQSDVAPYIENGRTMVPIRVITENLGYNVNWDGKDQSISITNDNQETQKNEGSLALQVNIPSIRVFNPEVVTTTYHMLEAGILTLDEASIMLLENSEKFDIDTAPVIKNNRTFVPVRVISEYMGLDVNWDNTNRIVTISNKKNNDNSIRLEPYESFKEVLDDISKPIEKSEIEVSTEHNFVNNSDLMGFI